MDSENFQNNDDAGVISLRLLRPSIVVLCGPAACGKSTFAEKHFRPTQIISSDWARARVCDDERDQRFNAQAFALVHFLTDQRLRLNRLCVVDSTALTVQARKDLLELAKRCQVPIALLSFNVPLETCMERDEKRERTVGRSIVERQYQAFEQSKAAIVHEGFDQVVELQERDIEKIHIEILFRPAIRPGQRAPHQEGGSPRRFERLPQTGRPHPASPGDNGRQHALANVTAEAAPAEAPRASQLPAVDAAPKTLPPAPPPVEASPVVTPAKPSPVLAASEAASKASQPPAFPPIPVPTVRPGRPAAPHSVPAGAMSQGPR